MPNIQKSARLTGILYQWHGGQGSAVYSVASRMDHGVDYSDPYVARAIKCLQEDLVNALRATGKEGPERDEAIENTAQLRELLAWLSGPTDTCKHFVSGEVHVYIDVVDVNSPKAEFAGRIMVRNQINDLHICAFDKLFEPQCATIAADSDEGLARAAASAISFFGYYGHGNRGDDVPDWAPPEDLADLINNGADRDEGSGEVVARLATEGEEP